jgi:hypothetical protein
MKIAPMTSQSQVVGFVRTAVLPRDYVLYMVPNRAVVLRKHAILAAALSSPAHKVSCGRVHSLRFFGQLIARFQFKDGNNIHPVLYFRRK